MGQDEIPHYQRLFGLSTKMKSAVWKENGSCRSRLGSWCEFSIHLLAGQGWDEIRYVWNPEAVCKEPRCPSKTGS